MRQLKRLLLARPVVSGGRSGGKTPAVDLEAHRLAYSRHRSALMQQHKLALATQICQSCLALAVLRRFAGFKLEFLAQGSVFANYLPFDRPMPEGSIADE